MSRSRKESEPHSRQAIYEHLVEGKTKAQACRDNGLQRNALNLGKPKRELEMAKEATLKYTALRAAKVIEGLAAAQQQARADLDWPLYVHIAKLLLQHLPPVPPGIHPDAPLDTEGTEVKKKQLTPEQAIELTKQLRLEQGKVG